MIEPRSQAIHFYGERKPHLNAGIKAVQIAFVGIQRTLDNRETERLFGVFVKRTHDPGHVDALFLGFKRYGPGH